MVQGILLREAGCKLTLRKLILNSLQNPKTGTAQRHGLHKKKPRSANGAGPAVFGSMSRLPVEGDRAQRPALQNVAAEGLPVLVVEEVGDVEANLDVVVDDVVGGKVDRDV